MSFLFGSGMFALLLALFSVATIVVTLIFTYEIRDNYRNDTKFQYVQVSNWILAAGWLAFFVLSIPVAMRLSEDNVADKVENALSARSSASGSKRGSRRTGRKTMDLYGDLKPSANYVLDFGLDG